MRASNFFFEAGIGHFAGAEDLDFASLQAEISRLSIGIKIVAVSDDAIVRPGEIIQLIPGARSGGAAIAAWPGVGPIQAPVERTYDAVIVHRGQAGLPLVHPLRVA